MDENTILAPGLLLLWLLILTFYSGALIVNQLYADTELRNPTNTTISNYIPHNNIIALIILFSFVCFFASIVFIKINGYSFDVFYKLSSFLAMAHNMTIERYAGTFVQPMAISVLLAFGFSASALSGMVYPFLTTKKQKLLSFLPLVSIAIYTAFYTAKAPLIFGFIFWISGLISIKSIINGYLKPFSIKIITLLGIGFFLLFVVTVMSQMSRGGFDDLERLDEVIFHVSTWFIGNITPFIHWASNGYHSMETYNYGGYTFSGIYSILGLNERSIGITQDYVHIGKGEHSNIYTMFRWLIQDFSISGSLAILFVYGALSQFVYLKSISGNISYIYSLLLAYIIIFWSPFASIISYNSVILALVFFYFLSFVALTQVKPDREIIFDNK